MCTNPQTPLLATLVNTLRDISLTPFVFRHTVKEITKILLNEALRSTPTVRKTLHSWRGDEEMEFIDESSLVIVSVLRAALPMHEAIIETLTSAESGFLGIKRDEETHESRLYYDRLRECSGKTVILVDTMVATGGSLCDAIAMAKAKGAEKIITLHVIGSPEGIARVESAHGDVEMFIAQIDRGLDENKFIVPGLGDAGDRAYNTL